MSKALRWAVLGVVLALLLRLWVLGSGPDLDTDSYGHARIGRLAMEHPTRLAVHWVWLPLWHFVLGGAARLGLGFTAMRVVDALLAAGVPLLTFAIVARASRSRVAGSAAGTSHGVAVLAAWFAAWFPLAITHGASAEPEKPASSDRIAASGVRARRPSMTRRSEARSAAVTTSRSSLRVTAGCSPCIRTSRSAACPASAPAWSRRERRR